MSPTDKGPSLNPSALILCFALQMFSCTLLPLVRHTSSLKSDDSEGRLSSSAMTALENLCEGRELMFLWGTQSNPLNNYWQGYISPWGLCCNGSLWKIKEENIVDIVWSIFMIVCTSTITLVTHMWFIRQSLLMSVLLTESRPPVPLSHYVSFPSAFHFCWWGYWKAITVRSY